MGYKITRKAAEDITHIYIEGVAMFETHQAEAYHTAMERTFELLAENPNMARQSTEITPPVRIHPYQSHLIVYVENDSDILIVRVRHGREDWKNNPTGA